MVSACGHTVVARQEVYLLLSVQRRHRSVLKQQRQTTKSARSSSATCILVSAQSSGRYIRNWYIQAKLGQS